MTTVHMLSYPHLCINDHWQKFSAYPHLQWLRTEKFLNVFFPVYYVCVFGSIKKPRLPLWTFDWLRNVRVLLWTAEHNSKKLDLTWSHISESSTKSVLSGFIWKLCVFRAHPKTKMSDLSDLSTKVALVLRCTIGLLGLLFVPTLAAIEGVIIKWAMSNRSQDIEINCIILNNCLIVNINVHLVMVLRVYNVLQKLRI